MNAHLGNAFQEDTVADPIDTQNFMYSALRIPFHAYLVAWNDIPKFYPLFWRNRLDVRILCGFSPHPVPRNGAHMSEVLRPWRGRRCSEHLKPAERHGERAR